MSKPDYLIVGTMKGGTTILYDFVCDHPDVVSAKQKEIHYFSLYYDKGEDWYSSFFNNSDTAQMTGEASPTYFDMSTGGVIPRLIKKDYPDTKIILVVRDPVERAISHFNHYCTINKVESVIEKGIERFFNDSYSDAAKCTTADQTFLYHVLNFSCYSQKFKYFKNTFGENMLVVSNDRLRSESQEVMSEVHSHLGLSHRSSSLFEEVRYSAGTKKEQISEETLRKLKVYLYPDYEKFCGDAGIEFREI